MEVSLFLWKDFGGLVFCVFRIKQSVLHNRIIEIIFQNRYFFGLYHSFFIVLFVSDFLLLFRFTKNQHKKQNIKNPLFKSI